MLLILLTVLPMLAAVICYGVGRFSKKARHLTAIAASVIELGIAVLCLFQPSFTISLGHFCGLGLRFALDGFRKVYLIVIAFLWLMTFLLSREYFAHYHHRRRYYFFNLMTLGATMGVFLSADLVTAFVFFEIMSFTSYPWVLHEQTESSIRAANTYLTVAVLGGLVALMGLFLLQWKLGSTELTRLFDLATACDDRTVLYIAGACILFGFGAKAGMFPLHIWLPKAHPVAPAPASALLSGLLTKTGVWGILAISCTIFRADPGWGAVILFLGTITMLLGALLALFSIDLKRTLACSSMSQIGFILVGIGMMELLGQENALAAQGVLLHMVNHSLFKLILFGCAGVIYFNTHTLDLNALRGFGRGKPLLCAAFLTGALGIGGVPGFSGYISKTLLHESIVEGAAHYGSVLTVVEWVFLLSGGLTVAYMTKLFIAIFIERPKAAGNRPDRHYWNGASAVSVLLPTLLVPALGMTASVSMQSIAAFGTDFFYAAVPEHAVAFFSPENLKGALISIVIGAAVYLLPVRRWMMRDGVYCNRWPERLDLEMLVYRPLLFRWIPALLGRIAALFGENRMTGAVSARLLRLGETVSAWFGENKASGKAAACAQTLSLDVATAAGENKLTGKLAGKTLTAGQTLAELTSENRVTGRTGLAVFRRLGTVTQRADGLFDLVFAKANKRLLDSAQKQESNAKDSNS